MKKRVIQIAAVIGLVVAACGASDPRAAAKPIDGAWQLESGTVNGAPVPLVDGYRITFNGEGSTFGGTAACNQYGATFAVANGAITPEEFFLTEIACQPEVMDSEAAYLTGLQLVERADRSGDSLVLSGPGVELRFIAVSPIDDQALIGTTWILESLIDGEAISTARGESLTLEFHQDGTMVAMTGCRTLTGTYLVVGDEITTPTLSAEGECTADLEAQDAHVIGVFEGFFMVEVDGDRLTLTGRDDQGLGYRAG